MRRRERSYLLRTSFAGHEPRQLWTFYIQLPRLSKALRNSNTIWLPPQKERIDVRIFVACCLQVSLKAPLARGITPREVLETIQMVDVRLRTTDRAVAAYPA